MNAFGTKMCIILTIAIFYGFFVYAQNPPEEMPLPKDTQTEITEQPQEQEVEEDPSAHPPTNPPESEDISGLEETTDDTATKETPEDTNENSVDTTETTSNNDVIHHEDNTKEGLGNDAEDTRSSSVSTSPEGSAEENTGTETPTKEVSPEAQKTSTEQTHSSSSEGPAAVAVTKNSIHIDRAATTQQTVKRQVHAVEPVEGGAHTKQGDSSARVVIYMVVIGDDDSSKNDKIILKNIGTEAVSLDDWRLRKRTKSGNESSIYAGFDADNILEPHEFFIWAHAKSSFAEDAHATTSTTISNNSSIALFDNTRDANENDNIVDAVAWGDDLINPFAGKILPNPTACQHVIFDEDTNRHTLAVQDREECQPIIYNGERLILNELLPNPQTPEKQDEFIEIYNPSDTSVDLKGWTLKDASKTGSHTFTKSTTIAAGGYYTVTKDIVGFALNNAGGETVSLLAPNNDTIDTVMYANAEKGVSYARREKDEWTWTPEVTPGTKNIFLDERTYPTLLITELLPNPLGDEETAEYIEIYNPTDHTVPLTYWKLADNSASGTFLFPDDAVIAPHAYLVLYRTDFGFALNNSGGETVSLIAPSGTVASTTTYTSAREGVIYGWTGAQWRWSATRTPGAENVFGEELLITKMSVSDAYKNAYTSFSADTNFPENDVKYRWDFGDGHKSYLRKTRHIFLTNGTYSVTLRVHNDLEEVVQTLSVEVTTFPTYKLRITEISPNPDGKDYANEYVTIENRDDETVSLAGWSVATGKDDDHLVNHPFRKKFRLKNGSSKKIRSPYAAISLPNKGGIVELRSPSGKVIDRKIYIYNNGASIPSGTLYTKEDKAWHWVVPPAKAHTTSFLSAFERDAIISQAILNDFQKTQEREVLVRVQQDITTPNAFLHEEVPFFARLFRTINSLLVTLSVQYENPKVAASAYPLITFSHKDDAMSPCNTFFLDNVPRSILCRPLTKALSLVP